MKIAIAKIIKVYRKKDAILHSGKQSFSPELLLKIVKNFGGMKCNVMELFAIMFCSCECFEQQTIDTSDFMLMKIAKSFAPNEWLDGGYADGLRKGAKLNRTQYKV